MKRLSRFLYFLIIGFFMLPGAHAQEQEFIIVPPMYVAWWDNLNPQNPYWMHQYAFGNSPQEACEGVLAQNVPMIYGYTYSHYMDDWVGRRCAIRSPDNPDVYSRLWIGYPMYLCPDNSSHTTPEGRCICHSGFFAEGQACTPPTISIDGASSTNALPSLVGPVSQRVSITHNGSFKKSIAFNLLIQEADLSASSSVSGVTNADGYSDITYVPPYFRNAEVTLTATCATCANTATKTISVSGSDEEPQMCRR